ncbi:formyltransferase family protein, partial [Pedobacter sp. ASV12]|uniref:formyltransferase family protein n=1 Tax=Pedobacter sp. ASV12 TaxID=2795120 RepID=UPI0018EA53C6
MRIFFIGTVKFSLVTLKALLESGANIVGVATKADSGFNADFEDLKPLCETYNIPCKVVRDINHPNNIKFINDTSPDVIYCFGWSNLLGPELLAIAPKGVIGFHPAKIPANRGRHPIIWALCLGLKTTASTFFFMDEGADTGDILSQQEIQIFDEDDALTLYEKIIQVATGQILEFTTKLALDTNDRVKQVGEGNNWRKRGRKDGEIDFRMSSKTIYNLVRALTKPYVGAHILVNGAEYKIWKVQISDLGLINEEPGKVLAVDSNGITVKT